MPSYAGLPPQKFQALTAYLASLTSPVPRGSRWSNLESMSVSSDTEAESGIPERDSEEFATRSAACSTGSPASTT